MSSLSYAERRSLEQALGMSSGYVAGFTNREFQEFVHEVIGMDVYDGKYARNGQSKAARLRAVWSLEDDQDVAALLEALHEHWEVIRPPDAPWEPPTALRTVASRLRGGDPGLLVDALTPHEVGRVLGEAGSGHTFSALVRAVREAVAMREPSNALDRLHTYLVRLFRKLCAKHGLELDGTPPLNAIAGRYFRYLRESGKTESRMAHSILGSSVKVLEDYNDVRNNWSLAHDNPTLSIAEANLIIGDIVNLVRFINEVEDALPEVSTDDEQRQPR